MNEKERIDRLNELLWWLKGNIDSSKNTFLIIDHIQAVETIIYDLKDELRNDGT